MINRPSDLQDAQDLTEQLIGGSRLSQVQIEMAGQSPLPSGVSSNTDIRQRSVVRPCAHRTMMSGTFQPCGHRDARFLTSNHDAVSEATSCPETTVPRPTAGAGSR
jgi:hypothetical protein